MRERQAMGRALQSIREDEPHVIPRSPVNKIGDDLATPQEEEFCQAMHRYKTVNRRPFPTWREVFAVFQSLGYRQVEAKTMPPRTARVTKRADT